MQKLQTVNAETLLYEPLEKPSFVVDSLIPTGLSLFCGSQKIGKSWLMLKLCLCVSQGIPLWDICYQYSRRKDGRRIALARRAGDSGDGGDSDIRIPPCYCH